jgi:cell shape-determining protein MreC
MNQLTNANQSRKGESSMVCEGILNICGTSSKEIEERTRKETAAEIQSLTDQNKQLSSENSQLNSENNYYRKLLTEHGIAF